VEDRINFSYDKIFGHIAIFQNPIGNSDFLR
jgi:hypothetical protein